MELFPYEKILDGHNIHNIQEVILVLFVQMLLNQMREENELNMVSLDMF